MTAVLSLLPSPPPSLDFERCYCCNHRTETQTEERRTSTETAEAHEAKWTEPIRMNSSLGRRSRSRLSNFRWLEVIYEDQAAFSVPTALYKLTLGSLGGALTLPPAPAPIPPPKDTSSSPIPRTISRRDGETLSALVSSNVAIQYMRI